MGCCFTTAVRRFLRKLSFFSVVLTLIGFVAFTIFIAQPLRGSEKHGLVEGTIAAAPELRPDRPFVYYVALHAGPQRAADEVPALPVQDVQPDDDGGFELSADAGAGTRFYLLARVETARLERYCQVTPLPELQRIENGDWVDVQSRKRLAPVRITVGKSVRCD